MKFTQYFLYTRQREDRTGIRMAWIKSAVANPLKTEIQQDGRIRKWTFIPETGKYLRIILLEDGFTVHNAFFDRGFKEEES